MLLVYKLCVHFVSAMLIQLDTIYIGSTVDIVGGPLSYTFFLKNPLQWTFGHNNVWRDILFGILLLSLSDTV